MQVLQFFCLLNSLYQRWFDHLFSNNKCTLNSTVFKAISWSPLWTLFLCHKIFMKMYCCARGTFHCQYTNGVHFEKLRTKYTIDENILVYYTIQERVSKILSILTNYIVRYIIEFLRFIHQRVIGSEFFQEGGPICNNISRSNTSLYHLRIYRIYPIEVLRFYILSIERLLNIITTMV